MLEPRIFELIATLDSAGLDWLSRDVIAGIFAGNVEQEPQEALIAIRLAINHGRAESPYFPNPDSRAATPSDMSGEGDLGEGFKLESGHFLLPEQLAYAMADDDESYLLEKLAAARSNRATALVFSVLLKTCSVDGLMAAARSSVGREVIRRQGEHGVQDMIFTKERRGPDGTSYELRPRNASALRRELFALTVSPDKDHAAFAVDYLTRIDMMRQEDGATEDEPRHPDICSGRPWPHVASPH